jgi:hypothetical protein
VHRGKSNFVDVRRILNQVARESERADPAPAPAPDDQYAYFVRCKAQRCCGCGKINASALLYRHGSWRLCRPNSYCRMRFGHSLGAHKAALGHDSSSTETYLTCPSFLLHRLKYPICPMLQ